MALTIEERLELLEAKLSIAELQALPALHNADVETATNATDHINRVQEGLAQHIQNLTTRIQQLEQ